MISSSLIPIKSFTITSQEHFSLTIIIIDLILSADLYYDKGQIKSE